MPMAWHRLATLVARGDAAAFEALYDRHHAALLAFCRHMVGNREDGEDALQQTFVRAHRALREGRRKFLDLVAEVRRHGAASGSPAAWHGVSTYLARGVRLGDRVTVMRDGSAPSSISRRRVTSDTTSK